MLARRIFQTLLVCSALGMAVSVRAEVRLLPSQNVWSAGQPSLPDWPGSVPANVPEDLKDGGERIFNVAVPSFQAYLPEPGKANGAGVIVAPGGGFRFLSIKNEGDQVARWLAEHGIAAFVLKYRTVYQRPGESAEQQRLRVMATMPNGLSGAAALEDGMETLRQIRAHAARYGVDPHRIGVVGFSAGGHVAGMMALAERKTGRPDFVGLIYGMPFLTPPPPLPAANLPFPPGTPKEPWLQPDPTPAPGALPPHFMVLAQNDVTAGGGFRIYYDALYAAGYRPELHLYQRGKHGFGMKPQGSTSDHWIDEFGWWIVSLGFTQPRTMP